MNVPEGKGKAATCKQGTNPTDEVVLLSEPDLGKLLEI